MVEKENLPQRDGNKKIQTYRKFNITTSYTLLKVNLLSKQINNFNEILL